MTIGRRWYAVPDHLPDQVPGQIVDDPGDAGFAEAYRRLPDAADLEPWLSWARPASGPVLYLGPGAGRLAVPLWRAGVRLVGVDAHPGMVAWLRERLPEMEIVEERWETLELGRTFELVIGPSSAFTGGEALRAAARHLAPGGHVGIELMNPHWLLAPGQVEVAHRVLDDGRVEIRVPYPSGHVQRAVTELRWPERIDEHLAGAGLRAVAMHGAGDSLTTSSTYYVLAAGDGRA